MERDPKPFLHLEHRQSRRRMTLKTGRLIFNNGHCVVECTVRDLSDEGARLELPCHLDLPETLILSMPGAASRDCEVVWSSNTERGVRFLGTTPRSETWSARATLRHRILLLQSQMELVQNQLSELRGEIEANLDT